MRHATDVAFECVSRNEYERFRQDRSAAKIMLQRKILMRSRLSTSPVDKPADSCVRSLRKARRSKGRKDYGEKMTSENV